MSNITQVYKDERAGNEGRKQWNARPQSAEDAQQILSGAIRTIDRLLDRLNDAYSIDVPPPDPTIRRGIKLRDW